MLTRLDDLFEINRYLERNVKRRLAFREFGTCLGVQCQAEQSTEKDRAVDLKMYADAIITAWDPAMELTLESDLQDDGLRPITRVMYATALIPGGEYFLSFFSMVLRLVADSVQLFERDISVQSQRQSPSEDKTSILYIECKCFHIIHIP